MEMSPVSRKYTDLIFSPASWRIWWIRKRTNSSLGKSRLDSSWGSLSRISLATVRDSPFPFPLAVGRMFLRLDSILVDMGGPLNHVKSCPFKATTVTRTGQVRRLAKREQQRPSKLGPVD